MEQRVAYRDYEIHYYEIDYKKRVLLTSILDYLGDIAIYQSEQVGVGLEYYKNNNIAWVLYKWDINIKRYPLFGEKITIKTVPVGFKRFYAYRRYDLYDEAGQHIGSADSLWFFIDTVRKRPMRVNEDMFKAYGPGKSEEVIDIEKPEAPSRIDAEITFNVRYSDIDTNKHVNNAKYVSWAIESVPIDIVREYEVRRTKVTYEKETTYGEEVKVVTEIKKGEHDIVCLHKIQDKEGNTLTLLQTTWEKL
jgi:medium-chain acyl-[acyl-carrier-protein] hydrolase